MLLSLRSSSLHCPLRPHHARLLTTLPRAIPGSCRAWDATRYRLLPPPTHATNPEHDTRTSSASESRQLERRELRDAQTVTINHRAQNPEEERAIVLLNSYLQKGYKGGLWKAYVLAKGCIPTLPSLMPDKAWDVLWDAQVKHNEQSLEWEITRETLHRDMDSVGKTSLSQRVAYLESLFLNRNEEHGLNGNKEHAIDKNKEHALNENEEHALNEWEEDYNKVAKTSRHDYKPEHLELGARLHALAGHPDRSRAIMEQLFDLYPNWDTSVMVSVFRAHTDVDSPAHHDTAMEIYLDLKKKLGSNMTLWDYDACFVGFLQARHLRFSKEVFRDMVKGGTLATSYSEEHIEEVLRRLNMLYCLGTDIEKMTSISLQLLSFLPEPYYSYLFSKWMHAAVVFEAPDVAAQVLDMMFSRGMRPDTKHFNYLLKALFRTNSDPRVLKAEDIGWRMIEEARISSLKMFPRVRNQGSISQRAKMTAERISKSEAQREVPQANITTFGLMIRHHGAKQQWEHVDYLTRLLRKTDLQPNFELMNASMDNDCSKGRYVEAWQTYKSLTDVPEGTPGVFPNGASIRCLWTILRKALGDDASRNNPGLPTPRELLAETVSWWERCRRRPDVERFRIGLAAANHLALESLMLHCFSYTQDLAGSLVALHVARTMDIFPSNKSAAILQNQAAWIDMHRETESVRSQYHRSNNFQNTVEKLSRVYYILMDRRLERCGLTEASFSSMNDEELGDLGLNLLSEFVRVILKRSHSPETVEAMIAEVKQVVRVPDMPTGDLDAFSVA